MLADVSFFSGEFLSCPTALRIYWFLAAFGSAFFVISAVLLLFGIGGDSSDCDIDGDGIADIHADVGSFDFHLISLRTILAFFTMFGWSGVLFGNRGWIGFLIALAAGIFTMVIVALLIAGILKLQQNGTVSNRTFVGLTGTVYMRISGGKDAWGKVTISLSDCTREITAIADEPLETGTSVVLTEYFGKDIFKVKRNIQ